MMNAITIRNLSDEDSRLLQALAEEHELRLRPRPSASCGMLWQLENRL
jgi:hypothetical protein